jgi:poly(3-hydroxybutyrate) depolymerase
LLANPEIARRIERQVIRRVPAAMPGAGRLVYPGAVQRAALTAYLLRRISPRSPTPLHVFQNLLVGDGEPPMSRRQLYRVFLRPMDLPAQLYLQTVQTLFVTTRCRAGACGGAGCSWIRPQSGILA